LAPAAAQTAAAGAQFVLSKHDMNSSFIAQLAAVGALAPSADNCQPWQLHWTGHVLELAYAARHMETNVFDAESHATLLGVGAVAENLQAALDANGVRAQWQWSEGQDQPYAALALADLPASFTRPDGPLQRHTNRLPFRRTALAPDLLARAGGAREGDARVVALVEPAPKEQLVRLVRLCAQARFCSRELHSWLFGSLRQTPEAVARGDGLDIDSLGLPPGGKGMLRLISDWRRMALLNRFGAYRLLARSEVALISAAPALVCVTGAAGRRGTLDAGRLLARVWTELNQQGVAVQPYYVVTDQLNRLHAGTLADGFAQRIGAVERELPGLLGLAPGEVLHMILRVGYPKRAPVRARRLPLAQVFADLSRR
jgi:hypothetical protein